MIYEGTNEIQANDLLLRKVLREPEALRILLTLIRAEADLTGTLPAWQSAAQALLNQCSALQDAVDGIQKHAQTDAEAPYRVAGDFLRWLAQLVLGFTWLRSARLAEGRESELLHRTKQESARYFFSTFKAEAQRQALRVMANLHAQLPFFTD